MIFTLTLLCSFIVSASNGFLLLPGFAAKRRTTPFVFQEEYVAVAKKERGTVPAVPSNRRHHGFLESTAKLYQQQRQGSDTRTAETSTTTRRRESKGQKSQLRTWNESYQLLLRFKEENGHCVVTRGYKQDPQLGRWVSTQRRLNTKGQLSQERKAKLEAIGFTWNANNQRTWDDNYQRLKSYRKKNGHCNVPYQSDMTLSNWIKRQRTLKDRLSKDQILKLDQIDFCWNYTRPWDETYRELVKYREEFGDCNVRRDYSVDPFLARWVRQQRKQWRVMSEDKRVKLDAINFTWEDSAQEINDKRWREMLVELKRYRRKHGTCDVPQRSNKVPGLGHWVYRQRKQHRIGKLSKEREQQLNDIGFSWRLRAPQNGNEQRLQEQWLDKYEIVKEFRQEYGHFNIPRSHNATLSHWIRWQRETCQEGRLRKDRKVLLEEIGFPWNVQQSQRDKQWRTKYEEIKSISPAYQVEGGSLKSNLATWANRQRVAYASGKLPAKRQRLLEDIGFVFKAREPYF